MSIVDLVCASEVEEFFYEDSDMPLAEGEPVGVDIDYKNEVKFVLFDNIYWRPQSEERE
tara:strand:- start:4065 stop:4241 length:177 start_codon:yes stop_codon:yes gene_type:complete